MRWLGFMLVLSSVYAFADAEVKPPKVMVFSAEEIAQAVDPHYSVNYKMPHWVDEVLPVCKWKSSSNGSFQGYVRLTLTQIGAGNQLYVQWLQSSNNGLDDKVLSTRVIEELEGKNFSFAMPSAKIFPDHCFLSTQAQGEDKLSYRIELTLREPGQYSYKQVRALGTTER